MERVEREENGEVEKTFYIWAKNLIKAVCDFMCALRYTDFIWFSGKLHKGPNCVFISLIFDRATKNLNMSVNLVLI